MKRRKKPGFFPLLVNLKKYPCLVIGGGKVALRKVSTLMNFNASVTVLSPIICKPLIDLAEKSKIRIIKKSYRKLYLKNFELIFCATDNPEINLLVYNDCKAEKKLLNVADVPELCDFILPATIKRGDLSVSVSSQGSAPFYAAKIRKNLENVFPPYYKDITDIAANYRSMVLGNKKLNSPGLKEKAFNVFFDIDWKNILDRKGKAAAMKLLKEIIKHL